MVGRIVCCGTRRETGLVLEYVGPLTLLTARLCLPDGLGRRQARRRLGRGERQLARAGVGRVVLPEQFPWGDQLCRLRRVDTGTFYREVADVLALAALEGLGVEAYRGRVALSGTWLSPELRRAALRLCPRVRGVRIDVPGEEGACFARQLQREYGLPVAPGGSPVDVTVAFGPAERAGGAVLALDGPRPRLDGLRLEAAGLKLPPDCAQQLLALLWEAGAVRREELSAVSDPETPDADGRQGKLAW